MNWSLDSSEVAAVMPEDGATGIDVGVHMDNVMLAIDHDEVASRPGRIREVRAVTLPTGEIVGVSGRGQDIVCCIEFSSAMWS